MQIVVASWFQNVLYCTHPVNSFIFVITEFIRLPKDRNVVFSLHTHIHSHSHKSSSDVREQIEFKVRSKSLLRLSICSSYLHFSLGGFYWCMFQLTDSLFSDVHSTDILLKAFFICYSVVDFYNFFWIIKSFHFSA